MPGPLSGRLLGIDGRPTRSARIALALVALTAFALAFVVTAGSATQATHPAPALTDEAPAVQEPVSATLRRAAPLPALRRERRRERRRRAGAVDRDDRPRAARGAGTRRVHAGAGPARPGRDGRAAAGSGADDGADRRSRALADLRLHRRLRLLRVSGRRWSRAGLAVVALGAVAFAVLAGVAARRVTAPDDEPKPATVRIVQAGDARLAVPADWAPARSGSTGLDAPRMVVLDPSPGLRARVVAVFGPADDASLVPAALRAQLRSPPARPRTTSLGGRPAWAYSALATRGSGVELKVTVLPTTAGVLALACTSPADEFTASDCGAEVRAVSVRGGATLRPSPVIALAARLPAVLAELDRERAKGRAALARARTRERQAVLAQDLARLHLAAASSLPAGGPDGLPLVDGLERSGRAYAALGLAAEAGSTTRFASARRAIRGAEASVEGAIDDVLAAADRRTTAVARTSSLPTADEPMRVPVVVLLALAALLAGALLGFALSGPTAGRGRHARGAPRHPLSQIR